MGSTNLRSSLLVITTGGPRERHISRPDLPELLDVPLPMLDQRLVDSIVERNDSTLARLGLGSAYFDRSRVKTYLRPFERFDLGIPEPTVAGQHVRRVHLRAARRLRSRRNRTPCRSVSAPAA